MSTQYEEEESDRHLLAHAVRRHLALIVAVALAFTAAAAGIARLRPAVYAASADVLVRPSSGNALSQPTATNGQQVTIAMATEAGLVDSPEVVGIVNTMLGTQLRAGTSAVTASVPENTTIVRVAYRAPNAEAAANGAQAFAEAFLKYRQTESNHVRDLQLKSLREQEAEAKLGLRRASEAARGGGSVDAATQVQLFAGRLFDLQTNIGTISTQGTNAGEIITPALVPARPAGLGPNVIIVLGLLAGLVAGAAAAVLREKLDARVRGRSELEVAGLPIFGFIPHAPATSSGLITDQAVSEAFQESYRQIRTRIVGTTAPPTVLVVEGINAVTGCDVAANLSLSLARAGYSVVLVDLVHSDRRLACPLPAEFVATRTVDSLDAGECQPAYDRGQVTLLPPAMPSGRYSNEALAGRELPSLLNHLHRLADYVIVAGPGATTADGEAVAIAGDRLILVAAEGQTRQREVKQISARSRQINVDLAGIVAVSQSASSRRRQSRTMSDALGVSSHGAVKRTSASMAGSAPAAPVGRHL